MKCIYCGFENTQVLDSRAVEENNSIRRRRRCERCGKRWTTYETSNVVPILVVKKNGVVQPFNKTKLINGITKACEKRPVGLDEIEEIADRIEKDLIENEMSKVSSIEIGERALDELKKIDEISYIRFAIVLYNFKNFQELQDFIRV